eukprot:1348352-Rhodomonas_salina.1
MINEARCSTCRATICLIDDSPEKRSEQQNGAEHRCGRKWGSGSGSPRCAKKFHTGIVSPSHSDRLAYDMRYSSCT